jgi:lysine-N-methylase
MQNVTAPDYFPKFSCIGAACEDTCCSGWAVNIDRDTYHNYKSNKHKALAPIFKIAVKKDTSPRANNKNNFGIMQLKPDGACFFLEENQLCAIQKHLGAQALSQTCKNYPRLYNRFGSQNEVALGISCPEAARLILLNPEPMQFATISRDSGTNENTRFAYRWPKTSDGDPSQMGVFNDFRALLVGILQCREISLGARLMLIGLLLEESDLIVHAKTFAHADELSPTLASFANLLAYPEQVEAQFTKIQPNTLRKFAVLTQLISDSLSIGASMRFRQCLLDTVDGLKAEAGSVDSMGASSLTNYTHSHAHFYKPYFQNREYIFENYLVNHVIARLFPFTRGSYLDLYREMVFNLSIIQVVLVGMAAKRKGLDDATVIQVFQSFARKSDHNSTYLEVLVKSLHADEHDSFAHIMWILKDPT